MSTPYKDRFVSTAQIRADFLDPANRLQIKESDSHASIMFRAGKKALAESLERYLEGLENAE